MQGNSGYSKHGALPRGPRLDAPGVLHHMRARGSARQRLFQADADREGFVQRLARVAAAEALTVYAWVLLPNHCQLLVRTGRQPLARSMRSLLGLGSGLYFGNT